MRVLHAIASVDPAGGGPASVISEFVPALRRLDCESEVVSLNNSEADLGSGIDARIHAIGPGGGGYRYSRALVPWLRENLRRFDCTLVHGIWTFHSYGAYCAHRNRDTPYFVYPHGMLDPWFQRTYPGKHLKKLLYWTLFERRVLRGARSVIFTCEQERQLARKSFPGYSCRESVSSLGAAAAPIPADGLGEANEFLRLYPHLRDTPFVLFLSRLHPKKGLEMLIPAFGEARKSFVAGGKGFSLVIAGPAMDENYLQKLESLATQLGIPVFDGTRHRGGDTPCSEPGLGITFCSMLAGGLKWGAIDACEALILPSHQENFGMVVIEALSAGRPALISDQVNIWREIEAFGAGFVEADTMDGTRVLLLKWAKLSCEERSEMRRRARAAFCQRFEIREAAKNLLNTISCHKPSDNLEVQPTD